MNEGKIGEEILKPKWPEKIKVIAEFNSLMEKYGVNRDEGYPGKQWFQLSKEQQEDAKNKFPKIVEKLEKEDRSAGKFHSYEYFFLDQDKKIVGVKDIFDSAVEDNGIIYMLEKNGSIVEYDVDYEKDEEEK